VKDKDIYYIQEQINLAIKAHEDRCPVLFDCPNCKHETLAKKPNYGYNYIRIFVDGSFAPPPEGRKCLTCGKTFRKEDKYIEVK
jgi:hypothetical protein